MLTLIAISVTAFVVFGLFVWLQERREARGADNTPPGQTGHRGV
jgi:hypothetical protein